MKSVRIQTSVWLCLMSLCAAPLSGQVPGGNPQLDPNQQRRMKDDAAAASGNAVQGVVSELYPGEVGDTGPQFVIHVKPRKVLVEAQADVQYYHTDNFFFDEVKHSLFPRVSETVMASSAQFALAPTGYPLWGGTFSPRVGYRFQSYNFGIESRTNLVPIGVGLSKPTSDFDFFGQTGFVDAAFRFGGNWTAELGVEYTQLTYWNAVNLAADNLTILHTFYKDWAPRVGLRRTFTLCPNAVASVGYEGLYHFVDAEVFFPLNSNDRFENILYANVTAAVCRYFVVQPYYRFKYTHFMDAIGGRDDILHSFGLGLHAFVTPYLSVRAFLNYDILRSSSFPFADYDKLDIGGGVNVTVRY